MRTTIYTAIFQSQAREITSRLGADSPHEAAKLARLRLDPQVVEPAAFELLAVRLDGAGPGGADAVWHYVGDCAACPPAKRMAVFASDGGTLAPDGAVFCASCAAKLRAHVEGEPHPDPLLVDGELEDDQADEFEERHEDRWPPDEHEEVLAGALHLASERAELLERLLREVWARVAPPDMDRFALVDALRLCGSTELGAPQDARAIAVLIDEVQEALGAGSTT